MMLSPRTTPGFWSAKATSLEMHHHRDVVRDQAHLPVLNTHYMYRMMLGLFVFMCSNETSRWTDRVTEL